METTKKKYKIAVTEKARERQRCDFDLIRENVNDAHIEATFTPISDEAYEDMKKNRIKHDFDAVLFEMLFEELDKFYSAVSKLAELIKLTDHKVNMFPIYTLNEHILMSLASNHFTTPAFSRPKSYGEFLEFIQPDKKYVIKRFFNARGLGKMHIDPNDYNHMRMLRAFYSGRPEKAESLLTPAHPSALNYEDEDKEFDMNIDNTFVMEDIGFEGIREYRLIIFKTKAYCLKERDGYHPLSGGNREDVPMLRVDEKMFPKDDIGKIVNQLYRVLLDAKAPYGSFDLYVKEDETEFDKRYGIFEWSNQFAFSFPISIIKQMRDHYTISLIELVKEYLGHPLKLDYSKTNPRLLSGRKKHQA